MKAELTEEAGENHEYWLKKGIRLTFEAVEEAVADCEADSLHGALDEIEALRESLGDIT